MDFKEKAVRNDLLLMQEKVPELKNFSEEKHVKMLLQIASLDGFAIISIIAVLVYLGAAFSLLYNWASADPELSGLGATRNGLVWFIALPIMIPVFIFVWKILIPRRAKKLRAIIAAKAH